jgi:hypothetical protein
MTQTALLNTADVTKLCADIVRGYDALIRERFGALTDRQRQRLHEINQPVEYVKKAVSEYESALEMPPALRTLDPRYRLLYGTRTSLEMILQCSYFLMIHHMRKTEPLNPDQMEAVYLMERCGRKMVHEVERLWAELKAEQQVSA